jgi:addiction module HigA family antidote
MATETGRPHRSDLAIHPGEILAEELEARGMTQRSLAEAIGRPEQAISEIVRGKKGITAETALQLSEVFEVSAEFWMNLQTSYALTVARQAARRRGGKAIERRVVRDPGAGPRAATR